MKLLELNHVEKSFDGLGVIKDISLSVEEGEIVSVIGPSGSGKSTLLRCATMLETMDSGEVIAGKAGGLDRRRKGCVRLKKGFKGNPEPVRPGVPEFQPVPPLLCYEEHHGCSHPCAEKG